MKKIVALFFIICCSVRAQELAAAEDIARMVSIQPPSKVSRYILGVSDGIYPNTNFWTQLGLRNIIQVQGKMIAKDRVVLMTITYSSTEQITIASLNTVSLLLVPQGENWKVLPEEFLDIYLNQGSKRAAVAVRDREEIFRPDLRDFDQVIAASIAIREHNENEQREHILKILREKRVPLDRVTQPSGN